MFKMKKIVSLAAAAALILSLAAGCNNSTDDASSAEESLGEITVVSREDGSGTRDAFVELMGIVDADENDATTVTAEITNSTSVMMTTVAGNESAIGYVSLGSLDASQVKAVKVDGAEATVDNINNGSYKVSRPFVICYVEDNLSDLAKDFIAYIMSTDGQKIIEEEKYIPVDTTEAYVVPETALTGEISISGSTSVGPVMEKLAAAYMGINTGVKISIEQSGSGAGIKAATEKVSDIGMSSRALKDSEKTALKDTTIALDGVAVIVNKANPVENLTSEQIKNIYLGEVTDWSEVE